MRQLLENRWSWLGWISPCIFLIGLVEVLNDAWFTVNWLIYSRIKFIPISSISRSKDGRWNNLFRVMQLLPMCLTLIWSAILILWRQRVVLLAPAVESAASSKAAMECITLSNGILGF